MEKINRLLYSFLFISLLYISANAKDDQKTFRCNELLDSIDKLKRMKMKKLTGGEEFAARSLLFLSTGAITLSGISAESNIDEIEEQIQYLRSKVSTCTPY